MLPPGFQHEVTRVDERATMFEVRDGSDSLVIVVYRGTHGVVPGASTALATHVEELAEALGGRARVSHEPQGLLLLGERRMTAHLQNKDPHERVGWVVAADALKGEVARATVVCSSLHLAGSPNAAAFVRIAASINSR
jgi:hypothetical protein